MLQYKTVRYLGGLIAGIAFGFIINRGLDWVEACGHYIPSEFMALAFVKAVIWAFVLLIVILVLPLEKDIINSLAILWGVRSCVTLGAMLIYEKKYILDAYYYFSRGLVIGSDANLKDLQGTQLVAWIVGQIVNFLPGMDSYHSLKVLFSFAGLMGVLLFYLGYIRLTGHKDKRLIWVLGLVPSILFWSSILGKDPLVFFGLGLFFYAASGLFLKLSLWNSTLMAIALAMTFMIRFWVPVLFMVPFLITLIISSQASLHTRVLLGGLGLSSVGMGMTYLMNKINVHSMADVVQKVSFVSSSWAHGGSGNVAPPMESLSDLVKFLPLGIFTTLFRPLPGEVMNMFGLMSGVENLLLLILVFQSIKMLDKTLLQDFFIKFTIILLAVWSSFYSFISYQNLGTAVRFKLQVLPFMVMWIFYIRHKNSQSTN